MHLISMHLASVYLMGMHLISVYLMGMHLISMYLMGAYLISLYLMGAYLISLYLMRVSQAFVLRSYTLWACILWEPVRQDTHRGLAGIPNRTRTPPPPTKR